MNVKSLLIALATLLSLCLPHDGQAQDAGFRTDRFDIRRSGDSVRVSFRVYAPHLKSDYRLDLTPVIYSNSLQASLPSARLSGKRAERLQRRELLFPSKKLFARRRGRVAGDAEKMPEADAGDTLSYRAAILCESWMSVVSLRIDATLTGCCSSQTEPPVQLAKDIRLCPLQVAAASPPPVSARQEQPAATLSPLRELARHERFIRPAADYLGDKQKDSCRNETDDGLRIYFRMGRSEIDTAYMNNAATLHRLEHVLNVIRQDSGVRVFVLPVMGYASVEGGMAFNSCLAGARADALKAFAVTRGVAPACVETVNGGEAWNELRHLAARNDSLPYRDEVLRLLDNVPLLRGRKKQLMNLHRGLPYRWMMKHLFPRQRNAGCIRIYFIETKK